MSRRMVAIMAVDPGGTTGAASGLFKIGKGWSTERVLSTAKFWRTWEYVGDFTKQAEELATEWRKLHKIIDRHVAIDALEGGPMLVMESFILRPGKASADPAQLMPVRVAAALEALLHRDGKFATKPEYQTPSMAKGYATDERLREWGLWKVGSAHERDAIRHLAYKLHSLER